MTAVLSKSDQIMRERVAQRRRTAIAAAVTALALLRDRGLVVKLVGSLATGRFHAGSDIDLLVLSCPPHLRYAVEADVEDAVGGFPFHVIYADEVTTPALRDKLIREAVDEPPAD